MAGEQQHLLVRQWDVVGTDQTLLCRQGSRFTQGSRKTRQEQAGSFGFHLACITQSKGSRQKSMQNYVMYLPCTPQFTVLLCHLTVQDNSQVVWTGRGYFQELL